MYTFYGQTCRMYTFYGWIVECIHSTVGAIECIHSMACGHGMYTFYTLFYRMYTFYISICRMYTFYDVFNNYTHFFCTKHCNKAYVTVLPRLIILYWPIKYVWFKHILFMMKRIGHGLNATRALSWNKICLNQQVDRYVETWWSSPGSSKSIYQTSIWLILHVSWVHLSSRIQHDVGI